MPHTGPARASRALRPARSAVPLTGPFLGVLQTIRRLLIRPECFRLEREFAGLGFHQGEQCTLTRHTHEHGGAGLYRCQEKDAVSLKDDGTLGRDKRWPSMRKRFENIIVDTATGTVHLGNDTP